MYHTTWKMIVAVRNQRNKSAKLPKSLTGPPAQTKKCRVREEVTLSVLSTSPREEGVSISRQRKGRRAWWKPLITIQSWVNWQDLKIGSRRKIARGPSRIKNQVKENLLYTTESRTLWIAWWRLKEVIALAIRAATQDNTGNLKEVTTNTPCRSKAIWANI